MTGEDERHVHSDAASDASGRPPVGSVAEEAAKLMEALTGMAGDRATSGVSGLAGGVAGLTDMVREVDAHVAGENCTYCPLCRLIALVRATSPEVRTHLSSAATSLLQAAASAMATQVPDESRRRSGPVEKIDLDDAAARDDWE